ncbi:hypothetical protein [Nocardia sp. NBC_00511]|uniref:hypothetical protein n=1 Tax=Nocardia sp. NBC_00511 TaxID=2903591 RepID=UPI002F90B274
MTSSLPTQEQIFLNAADAAHAAAGSLSDVRDWLQSDWSDTKSLTNEAADARTAVRAKLVSLKEECYQLEQQLREGATSLRNRR